ncbi:creatininase family protein [Roseomonas marmotae]|uniref:Creatininase family protein n=1 Tax=Roseomonas marmotae TaxID=2768161 RepID=A0ABS3K8Q4_9PROT|nr:creatininase family protein [Roseomonas marmotae]MBO1072993.1 creatininase family protein [Roseomonas marmotae]QTI79358.1 creatininase family protein [Roseomonas marmotae]
MTDTGTDAVRWERRTAPELRALAERDALVVLPVASLEQHGPHLPVWTDSMIGHACALRAAAEATDVPAIVLPPMWTGMSEHHLPFGGTISLDYATFHGVLRCVCRSIRAGGFKRLLLLNSHGGNIDPLAVSARELCVEFAMPVATTTVFHVAREEIGALLDTQPGVQHACEAETSFWLHLDAAQVRRDQIAHALSPGDSSVAGPVSRFWSFTERAPLTGVIGDPRAATAEKGEKLLAAVAKALAAVMRNQRLWSTPDAVWTPGRVWQGHDGRPISDRQVRT